MTWEILVEVRIASRMDAVVFPVKEQIRNLGWYIEKVEQTLNWTKLTCKVPLETRKDPIKETRRRR